MLLLKRFAILVVFVSSSASFAQSAANKTDLEVLRTYVLYQVTQEKYSSAIASIDRFLKTFPGNAFALNLKNLLNAKDKPRILDLIQTESLYAFGLELESGYNSNVLLLSDQTLDTLSRSETASAFYGLKNNLSIRLSRPKESFSFSHFVSFRDYFTEAADPLSSLTGAGFFGYQKLLSSRIQGSVDFGSYYALLDQTDFDLFNVSFEVSPKMSWQISDTENLSVRLPIRYQNYETISARNGPDFGLETRYRGKVERFIYMLGFDFSQALTNDDQVKTRTYHLPLALDWQAFQVWALRLSCSAKWVDYHESSTDRQDKIISPDFSVMRKFYGNYSAKLRYSFAKSFSSLSSSDYDRHEFNIGVGYDY